MRTDAREELVKLRTGLARLAMRAGLAEYVPGAPPRDAPFEVLVKLAETNERGWNALIARLFDSIEQPTNILARIKVIADDKVEQQIPGWGAWETVQRLIREGAPNVDRHEPGCDIFAGKALCSCSPYSMEG